MFKTIKGGSSRASLFLYTLFIIQFLILLFFQTDFLNTGDAGELISASYGLGIAHPSGYPLYLMFGKILTFLPFGSLAFKVALLSSVSSALVCVFVVYFILKETKEDYLSALFASLLLFFTFSFFAQSTVAKFYPINNLLILIVFYLGYLSLDEYKKEIQLSISFLLGLSVSLHHTTFFLGLPLLVLVFVHKRDFLKNILFSIFLFLIGSSVSIYIMLRSFKPLLVKLAEAKTLLGLKAVLLREVYGSGNSINTMASLATGSGEGKYLNAVTNIYNLINNQYGVWIFILVSGGLVFVIFRSIKKGLYLFLTLLSYSLILAVATFSNPYPGILDIYITGHQYFLPMFVFISICSAFAIYSLRNMCKSSWKIRTALWLILVIPFSLGYNRVYDSDTSSDHVINDRVRDMIFSAPVKSVYVVTGDNEAFSTFYVKNLGKFRDDICAISAANAKNYRWDFNIGCFVSTYGEFYPQVKSGENFNFATFDGLMSKHRVYATTFLDFNENLRNNVVSVPDVLSFAIYPKRYYTGKAKDIYENKKAKRAEYGRFLNYDSCVDKRTDDVFSGALCNSYILNLVTNAEDISTVSGIPFSTEIVYKNRNLKYSFFINEQNSSLVKKIEKIILKSDPGKFQLRADN